MSYRFSCGGVAADALFCCALLSLFAAPLAEQIQM
jgi:hypothetical protein